jgi:glycosyltransferase involved in cell wall biosynthesis
MQNKPRIAIISRLYPRPDKPHTGVFNRLQFQGLSRRYRISLLVPVPLDEWLRHRRLLAPCRDGEIEVRYVGWAFLPKVGRSLYPTYFGLSLLSELSRLRDFDPDCLLVSWAYPDAVGAAALNRVLKVPLIIKAHGSDLNVHAAHPLRAAQVRWAVRSAAAIVCVSEALRQRAIALGVPAEKVLTIRNGVDLDRFRPMPRSETRRATGQALDRRTALFVGNVLATKGVRELFAAFERLSGDRPELDLVVVGEGPDTAWLRAQASRAALANRVRLVGRVPHAELAMWFNAADVTCLPSHAEGLPNVLLEAMACGIPCVATAVGGIPEVVSAVSGELVPVRDVGALAAALSHALDGRWDRDAIVAEAARFSWQNNLDAMAGVIGGAIASGCARL